jgi:hypothetical protein
MKIRGLNMKAKIIAIGAVVIVAIVSPAVVLGLPLDLQGWTPVGGLKVHVPGKCVGKVVTLEGNLGEDIQGDMFHEMPPDCLRVLNNTGRRIQGNFLTLQPQ